jgi:SET domain-containing protein
MQVRYRIEKVKGKGNGIVADEFIPKGTLVWIPWQANPPPLYFRNETEVETYLQKAQFDEKTFMDLFRYSDGFGNLAILYRDDIRFMNHEDNGNTDALTNVTIRDIQPGEEINCDYRELVKHTPLWFIAYIVRVSSEKNLGREEVLEEVVFQSSILGVVFDFFEAMRQAQNKSKL